MLSVIMLNVAENPFKLKVIMLSIIMLSVIILSVIMFSVIMLTVIMMSVIMLSVVTPSESSRYRKQPRHHIHNTSLSS
jgi:hypothetical protein